MEVLINFSKLRYRNFLSSGNTFTEIDLKESATTLVVGHNGAGKCLHRSTLVDVNCDDPETQKKLELFLKKY